MTFYDAEDLEIGADVRSAETFFTGQFREFSDSPVASVSKAVLSISKIPLSIARDNIATRVKAQGFIEVVPPNTIRYNHDLVTLAPLGALIEPEDKNLIIDTGDITTSQWTRSRVTVTITLFCFCKPGLSSEREWCISATCHPHTISDGEIRHV